MDNYRSYSEMDTQERQEFLTKLSAIFQHDDVEFHKAQKIIAHAQRTGLFDKVKIGNAIYSENNSTTLID